MTHSYTARSGGAPARLLNVSLCLVLAASALLGPGVPGALGDELRREVPYRVEFKGELDSATRALIEKVSSLSAGTKSPPVSDVGLRRRVKADLKKLEAALRAEGYYASTLVEHIDLKQSPATVRIDVVEGPRYVVGDILVRLVDERPTPHAVALLRSIERPASNTAARSSATCKGSATSR